MNPHARSFFEVMFLSAAIFVAILLAQWAFGQERPDVPHAESPLPAMPHLAVPVVESAVSAPPSHVAEVECVVTVAGTPLAEQVRAAVPADVTVPVPGVAAVTVAGPVNAAEFIVATGMTSIDNQQQPADVGVTAMNNDIYAIARHDPGTTVPWVSPWELRDAQFDGAVLDSARATALLLACDDEQALREHLLAEGVPLRQPGGPGAARPLPDFLVGVTAYEYAAAYCQADQDTLEKIEPSDIAPTQWVTVLRLVNNSTAAVKFALANPERKFLVITDIHGLSTDALRVLAGDNIVGVVVGHYRHADDEPMDFATSAADVLRVTRAVRLVSDAPILLAVGAVNIHTRDTERAWADAFGDNVKLFDGFALYGLVRFPAILEAAENPRTLILRRMGLPDKPCVLLEFTGTSFQYAAAERPYVEKVWAARAKPLLTTLKTQGFRGLVTWSPTLDDATVKADALRNVMK